MMMMIYISQKNDKHWSNTNSECLLLHFCRHWPKVPGNTGRGKAAIFATQLCSQVRIFLLKQSAQIGISGSDIILDCCSSVKSLDWLSHWGDTSLRDDSAEILFQSQEALVSSSGIGRDVHSLMLSIQHFLCQPWYPEGWFTHTHTHKQRHTHMHTWTHTHH